MRHSPYPRYFQVQLVIKMKTFYKKCKGRLRKYKQDVCLTCSKIFESRFDLKITFPGNCASCNKSLTHGGEGNCYKTCIDCGKISFWIKDQERCQSCFVKYRFQIKENHPRWKTDRNTIAKNEHKHLDHGYQIWFKEVKNRDGWKCKISNSDCSGQLESHHILRWTQYPELRYEVNNGITLCHFHHPRKRNDEMRLTPYFRELIKTQ